MKHITSLLILTPLLLLSLSSLPNSAHHIISSGYPSPLGKQTSVITSFKKAIALEIKRRGGGRGRGGGLMWPKGTGGRMKKSSAVNIRTISRPVQG
ncbi:hypothetical protein OROGR_013512 [Orobanche gracilis]